MQLKMLKNTVLLFVLIGISCGSKSKEETATNSEQLATSENKSRYCCQPN